MITVSEHLPDLDLLQEVVLDQQRDTPLHAQLRNSLQRLIWEKFENNDRFYSETQLIAVFKISQGTVRRALSDLVTTGLLERRPARGTLVRKPVETTGLLNLAVFLPEWFSPNLSRILQLLNIECLKRGISLQPFYTHQGEHLLKAYEQLKFRPQEGGVVLLSNSPQATNELSAALEDKGYHYVVVDTLVRNTGRNFVGTCNQTGITLGLDYLTGLGHRRIALLVNEPEENENVRERIAAFEKYVAQRTPAIEAQIFHSGAHLWDNSSTAAVKVMEDIWSSPTHPTAIFTISDYGAVAAITWLQKRGVKIPQEVSVLGSDGSEIGGIIHPGLTSVAQPFEKISESIIEILGDRSMSGRQVFLPPHLVYRESVAPPTTDA
jgi:DNA-binding LacI/PurR family transcriptional regulator